MDSSNDRGQAQPGVLAPGTTVLQYKIIERIGSGGMAEVYLAEDTRLGRKAALKFLFPQYAVDPDIKQRFAREAQAAAALSHPNIVTIYEVAEYQGRPYIAMEYVDGGSLRDVISVKDLSTGEFIGLAIQICEGLSAAHRAGIVHRDIKPQNILISRDGRPKISDFGLARFEGSSRITQDGTTVGTLAYMSPEQAKATDVDQRADIFSLGAVLYEMITRRLPFAGQSEGAIINAILNDVPEPLARYKRDVPEALEKIIEKALLKDREERYQHVDDLVADLRREKRSREFAETSKLYGRVAPARPARPTRRLL
ncbi:MAG: serine/threonine-protein kinase, partial [bacterium]